jgi:hypothetical protein
VANKAKEKSLEMMSDRKGQKEKEAVLMTASYVQ